MPADDFDWSLKNLESSARSPEFLDLAAVLIRLCGEKLVRTDKELFRPYDVFPRLAAALTIE
jgi:hypothetical protein